MGLEHAEEVALARQQALKPTEHPEKPLSATSVEMRHFHDRLFAERKGGPVGRADLLAN